MTWSIVCLSWVNDVFSKSLVPTMIIRSNLLVAWVQIEMVEGIHFLVSFDISPFSSTQKVIVTATRLVIILVCT